MIDLRLGDCRDVLRTMADDSIDAIVTDPPYNLGFMGKGWDKTGIANDAEMWAQVLRVAKPGAHLLAFGGTRTYHRMVCAIEDAGWEIRDTIAWVYGSGFPKSLDVSKAIDRAAGAEREVIGRYDRGGEYSGWSTHRVETGFRPNPSSGDGNITQPATDAAREWAGWGTALKPAMEPICVARKPLSEKTVAANVLRWGCGAVNVDACRIQADSEYHNGYHSDETKVQGQVYGWAQSDKFVRCTPNTQGRWPANLIHDGSDEVVGLFPHSTSNGGTKGGANGSIYANGNGIPHPSFFHYDDTGSAARFFYCAKASKADREDSNHPTMKPTTLMRYLVRLVTPPNGIVFDPFMGSGSTGKAAVLEGFNFTGIELDAEYFEIAKRRIKNAQPALEMVTA